MASVSFNPVVACYKSLHINDYTDKEVFECWYTPKEYKQIKREVTATLTMMDNQSNFADGINFSARGLEHRTKERATETLQHRFFAIDAVLDEQEQQWQEHSGPCDPQALCLVYAEYSFASHMAAFLTGAKDEMAVVEYNNRVVQKAVHPVCERPEVVKQGMPLTSSCKIQNPILSNLLNTLPMSQSTESGQMNVKDILSVLDEVENTLAAVDI